MFAALSENNKIVEKTIGKFIALAPPIFMVYKSSEIMEFMVDEHLTTSLKNMNVREVFPVTSTYYSINKINSLVCTNLPLLCNTVIKIFSDANPAALNHSRYKDIFNVYPTGTSIKNLN